MTQFKCLLTFLFFSLFYAFGCQAEFASSRSISEQEQLAKRYCGNCHSYVPPSALPKEVWQMDVLPQMGHRLGIYAGDGAPDSLFSKGLKRDDAIVKGIFPSKQLISDRDWQDLRQFYLRQSALDTPATIREAVDTNLSLFTIETSAYNARPPLTTMIKILPAQQSVVLSDGKSNVNTLVKLNSALDMEFEVFMKDSPVDYLPGSGGAFLLTVGQNLYPSDRSEGAFEFIYASESDQPNRSNLLADKLSRPVAVVQGDLLQNGRKDFVVAEFGNHLGRLSMLSESADGSYRKQVILDRPGATHSVIKDLDDDGWQDVITLFSQGNEAILFFKNDQGQLLPPKTLLQFSPLAGSTYFEFLDWNGDGIQDILYTCGDNADLSVIVKEHHGIYLYLGDGDSNFEQTYFHHMPGCYKALARDFDLDGDLDIASISFFPDYTSKQPKHFVYIEQKPDSLYPRTLNDGKRGRWMTMDAGDLDQDGDIDLAMGSFVGFHPLGDTTNLYNSWIERGPSMILLRNNINQ